MKNIYIWLLLSITLISCKPVEQVRYIEVPKIEYQYKTLHDSIRDSIYVSEKQYIAGDTVFVKAVEYRYKDRILCDTVAVRDSIVIVQEIEKPIEKPVPYVPTSIKILATIGFAVSLILLLITIKKYLISH